MRETWSFQDHELCARLGEEGIARLVAAFYRQVPEDELLAPMYPPGDLADSEERLRQFLVFRFGGTDRYVRQRGQPRLRQRHTPFPIDVAARDRWLLLMGRALTEAELPTEETSYLRAFFAEVAAFLQNRP